MKLVNYYRESNLCLGVKTEKGVIDVESALKGSSIYDAITVDDLIKSVESDLIIQMIKDISLDETVILNEQELTLGPCISKPEKIICVGLNYRKHADECGMAPPKEPILFSKFNNSLTGSGSTVEIPSNSLQVDYEVELAIIIGKEAKNISIEKVDDYIFGYCVANDISARDLQFKGPQWLLGKSCDGFCPVGPYVVTKDEIEDPNNLKIKTWLNDEIRQNSNTSDMIFNCQEIVSYVSKHMTLKPGDIILTGTPEGVIVGDPEEKRVWIKASDKVTVEIEKLGRLTNNFS